MTTYASAQAWPPGLTRRTAPVCLKALAKRVTDLLRSPYSVAPDTAVPRGIGVHVGGILWLHPEDHDHLWTMLAFDAWMVRLEHQHEHQHEQE